MKSITIHKLDDELSERLAKVAQRDGTSLNMVIKRLLRTAVGLDASRKPDHRSDFEELFGTWTEAEAEAFGQRVREFDEVDGEEW